MSGFLWTGKRDRALIEGKRDGFTFRECAAMIGCGCTESEARGRFKVLRAEFKEYSEGASGTARKAPGAVSSGTASRRSARAPHSEGDGDGSSPSPVLPQPARSPLIQLPKYGEMEKKYDPATRAKLGIG